MCSAPFHNISRCCDLSNKCFVFSVTISAPVFPSIISLTDKKFRLQSTLVHIKWRPWPKDRTLSHFSSFSLVDGVNRSQLVLDSFPVHDSLFLPGSSINENYLEVAPFTTHKDTCQDVLLRCYFSTVFQALLKIIFEQAQRLPNRIEIQEPMVG